MGFQDVALLPSTASFYTNYQKNCGGGKSLRTTTCLKTEVVGKKGCSLQNTFTPSMTLSVLVEFHRDHNTVTKLR